MALGWTSEYCDKLTALGAYTDVGSELFILKKSKIQGLGVFSRVEYKKDTIVGLPLIEGEKTILGRYVNHSATPNTKGVVIDGIYYIMTTKKLDIDEELTICYVQVQECINGFKNM